MADSNLPSDVDIDGDTVAPLMYTKHARHFPTSKSNTKGHDSIGFPKEQLLKEFDCRETSCASSGYGSYCSNQSLSSPGSHFDSVQKSPVQCSDDAAPKDITDLSSDLSKLELSGEQEEEISGHVSNVSENLDVTFEDNFDLEEVFTEEDGDGDTLLHNTILNEMISVVLCLIEICPNVAILNTPNKLFQTPLHLAVLTNLSEVVRKLVLKNADVLVRDQQGNTPLHIACRTGNKDIIEAIVESVKGDSKRLHKLFTLRNSEGLSCLHIAAEKKHYIIMGYLMANGADVNIGDAKSGRTVLHYAVERRDMETVKKLLTHKNIDVDCVTFKGESPLVIAYWRNYQEIVKKLRSKGAFFSFDLVEEWDEEGQTS